LGQSLDGFIAGADGQSRSLNGPENIVHLHRLRALFDVVLVGRSTATADDPQLTTRLVEGSHAVRVVFDPLLRCDPGLRLFNDDVSRTLIVCAADAPARDFGARIRVLRTPAAQDQVKLADVLAVLRAEGLQRIFIEGGGRTVSAALQEGLLDRLHVAVAPLFVGNGIRGVSLPQLTRFADALRPRSQRFDMGNDVLFDFDLRVRESDPPGRQEFKQG
jgi:riboflavin-specific deaminase-like protein